MKRKTLGIGLLAGLLLVVGAYAAVAQSTTTPAPTASTCEDANDGPDQGPDADPNEAGHQDASDAGDAAEPAGCGDDEETADDKSEAEADGIDHEYEGEEENED